MCIRDSYRTALQKIEDYDYDCILLDIATGVFRKRIAGELESLLGNDVVPAGKMSLHAELPAGDLNHLQLLFQIVALRGSQEGEIQIPQIVIYGSASCGTPGQISALLLQKLRLALPDGVLIPSYSR